MRGDDRQQAAMWSYISPEQRVPPEHPLRPIRAMVDTILADLSGDGLAERLLARSGDRERRRRMERAVRARAKPDAAKVIVDKAMELVGR